MRDEFEAYKLEQAKTSGAVGGQDGLDADDLDPELAGVVDEITHPSWGGSDWGGSGGSGSGGSGFDWGSSGGADWSGSDWSGSDWSGSGGSDWGSGWDDAWTSSLLDDTIDTRELAAAASEVQAHVRAGSDALTAAGLAALDGATDALGFEAASILGTYGPKLTEMAQRYGVQAGLVLGGVVGLYATRGQTTEAVAHVAEFFSTKCGPAVSDVMEQVGGVAKETRVSLTNAKSNVVASVRGERVGDLVG